MVDDRPVSIQSVLVQNGWLRPVELDDTAQAAIAERRGGWACASTETPFALMHNTVDPKVLAGIALNESAYDGHPWPWTLNVAGRGYFFRHREGAYRVVEDLLSHGRCDFDVGIMQINWCYHHQRFRSAWDALSPATNIRVAEDILNENYSKTHSVSEAIAYYHSANPVPGREYFSRFVQHYAQLENGL
jgi:Transglycosylase SLT domain